VASCGGPLPLYWFGGNRLNERRCSQTARFLAIVGRNTVGQNSRHMECTTTRFLSINSSISAAAVSVSLVPLHVTGSSNIHDGCSSCAHSGAHDGRRSHHQSCSVTRGVQQLVQQCPCAGHGEQRLCKYRSAILEPHDQQHKRVIRFHTFDAVLSSV